MIRVIKHQTAGEALIKALTLKEIWVEIIDPSQSGRAVVERKQFFTRKKAQNFIDRQTRIDHWNRYELVIK